MTSDPSDNDSVLKRLNMRKCSTDEAPVINSYNLISNNPKSEIENEMMKQISYAFIVGSIM